MTDPTLQSALASVPAGRWAVGVSGGADSVALLMLLRQRADLSLHVVHLDHQTRGAESSGDAAFVGELARRWGLACTLARRDEIEPALVNPPANRSALFRQVRLELFKRVVHEHGLAGVILAHHADDQAETILQRLLRGSGPAGLAGISPRSVLGGLVVLRPLLGVTRQQLREYLQSAGQPWREDSSNASDKYQRNRVRKALAEVPGLSEAVLEMGRAMGQLRDWVQSAAPHLEERFDVSQLRHLPQILATESARRWLMERGAPAGDLSPESLQRLVTMANDAATAPRQHFPGGVLVSRRGGKMFVE